MGRNLYLALLALGLVAFGGCNAGPFGYPSSDDDDDAAYSDDDDDDDDDDDGAGDDDDSTLPPENGDEGGLGGGFPDDDDDDTPSDDDDDTPDDVEDDICEGAPTEPTSFYVSADDSNSQAQPAWIRSLIEGNSSWGSDPIRPYEFLNYYDFDFGAGTDVRIVPQLRETDDGLSLLVAVVGPDRVAAERRPMNLTFSLDLSGSMGGSGINGMRDALEAIAPELRLGDYVSVVEWSGSTNVILDNHPITGPNDSTFLGVVNAIGSGGGTDLSSGLVRAYEIAEANASSSTLDRVVLISDGGANLGETSADLIALHAEDGESDGIYLAAIGTGGLQEALMNTVSDLGRGSYLFIDSDEEAERKLQGSAFLSAFDLAAREVQLQVTLPESVVIDVFSGEEISVDPEEVQPQHLAPNDAMLYHFELVDCGDVSDWATREIVLDLTWLDPVVGTAMSDSLTVSLQDLATGPADQVLKADAILAYTQALAGESPDLGVVAEALVASPSDPDLLEISSLLAALGFQP
ncbi:MAG: VWA domain-containing protein [Deltaproteobacteria bacterium]|nr:VWA domain-containing protein [Deltaproteobacteria bacterium]